MHFSYICVAAFSMMATTVHSLQNIHIGTIQTCGGSNKSGPEDWYVWFSDSPACTSGTDLGPSTDSLCEKTATVLGHTGITFTGCGQAGAPTGISDNGAPALTCVPESTVPEQKCPSPCGDVVVTTSYTCS